MLVAVVNWEVNNKRMLHTKSLTRLNPYFITGFADAESSFYISITKNKTYKTGFIVELSFSINLHIKDIAILKEFINYFGVGYIFYDKKK